MSLRKLQWKLYKYLEVIIWCDTISRRRRNTLFCFMSLKSPGWALAVMGYMAGINP